MMMRVLAISIALGVASPAWAHKPTLTDNDHSELASAFEVEDPQTSIVVYHDAECGASQLWMTFDAEAGEPLFVQLGVPVLDRYETLAPRLAVLAAGLPSPDREYPFEIPQGFGILEIDEEVPEENAYFFEPFSGTESWILQEGLLDLPEAGRGYIVGWHEEPREAKFWVSVGIEERFGPDDFDQLEAWLLEVQRFHETGEYARSADDEDATCAVESALESQGGGGCSVAPNGGQPGAALEMVWLAMGLLSFGMRRRWIENLERQPIRPTIRT